MPLATRTARLYAQDVDACLCQLDGVSKQLTVQTAANDPVARGATPQTAPGSHLGGRE